MRTCQVPPFWNYGRGANLPAESSGGGAHYKSSMGQYIFEQQNYHKLHKLIMAVMKFVFR